MVCEAMQSVSDTFWSSDPSPSQGREKDPHLPPDQCIAKVLEVFPDEPIEKIQRMLEQLKSIDKVIDELLGAGQSPQVSQSSSDSTVVALAPASNKPRQYKNGRGNRSRKAQGWGSMVGHAAGTQMTVNSQHEDPPLLGTTGVGATGASQWEAAGRNLANTIKTQLKERQLEVDARNIEDFELLPVESWVEWLKKGFPSVEEDIIVRVCEECDYNIGRVLVVLSEMSAAEIQNQLLLDDQVQLQQTKYEHACSDDERLQAGRDAAHAKARKAQQLYKQANAAYQRRNFSEGHTLARQASRFKAEADAENRALSKQILAAKNSTNQASTLDLHGLYACEVRDVVKSRLAQLDAATCPRQYLHVVVGKGKHSENHQAVIPSVVESLLIEMGRVYVKKEGVILVKLVRQRK